jgi:hypothetical protein
MREGEGRGERRGKRREARGEGEGWRDGGTRDRRTEGGREGGTEGQRDGWTRGRGERKELTPHSEAYERSMEDITGEGRDFFLKWRSEVISLTSVCKKVDPHSPSFSLPSLPPLPLLLLYEGQREGRRKEEA